MSIFAASLEALVGLGVIVAGYLARLGKLPLKQGSRIVVWLNLELYQALKDPVGEEAARVIAAAMPPLSHLATKDDIARCEPRCRSFVTRYARTF